MNFRYLLFWIFLIATEVTGQVKLPRLISDGVVLQRNEAVKIWGWASAGENIEVRFNDVVIQTTADHNGNWEVKLPPQPAGGPHTITIRGNNEVTISNVLFGDVWICSGQSNMELTMERVKEKYAQIIASCENPYIRQFNVPDQYDFEKPHTDLEGGNWQKATPENIMGFSAVAYFFARELYEKYNVPVGLILSALGGSPVEAWMSEDALRRFPEPYAEYKKFLNKELIREIEQRDRERSQSWYASLNEKDEGLKPENRWRDPYINDNTWEEIKVPGYWAETGYKPVNGSIWFRKDVTLPPSAAGKSAKLWLGRIVDQDSAFVNGTFIGTTSYQYPPRRYTIPEGILKDGKNTIVVRVINSWGKGGFVPDKPYYLAIGTDTIDLKGKWKYKLGTEMPPLEGPVFIRWKPVGLYNKMIAPLLNLRIKGVIWYQGEANTRNPQAYQDLFPALIANWREKWGQGDFPFLYVQLANFMEAHSQPVESHWAALRQAQLNTLSVPNTGMAVTIDLGEWNDIHPLNKADVGKRLALLAFEKAYGEKGIISSGPLPVAVDFGKREITITFKNADNGLVIKGGKQPRYFAVSADGKNFQWADARIKENQVVVSSKVKNPIIVRYAWADNPDGVNLYNWEGLPASPFELKKQQ